MSANLSNFKVALISAAFCFFATSFMWAEEADAAVDCYAGITTSEPPAPASGSPINFPGVSYDSLTGWRTYGTIAQLFRTGADVSVTSVRLNNIYVTGTPGDMRLAITRTTNNTSYPPYYTPFPLSVPPEGQTLISEAGPAGEWVTYHLNTPVSLTAGNYYAVGLYVDWPDYPPVPPDSPDDYWSVQRGFNIPYSNGRIVYLTDTGWATMSDDRSGLFFEVCFDSDITYVTVAPVTGGEATLVTGAGTLGTVTPIDVPTDNTPSVDFPYGMFDLSVTGLSPGATTTLTLTFDQNIAIGSKWWKYLGASTWISLDIGSDDGDNVITVDLQDGVLGDTDPNPGVIGDPGGPGLLDLDDNVDHFKCYKARADKADVTVSLEDQFGLDPEVRVKRPKFFCNPVTKMIDGEVTQIDNPTVHQTGYTINSDDKANRRITVSNQFGEEQVLSAKKAKLLFVPTEKDGVPSDLNVDHFKCYEASGDKVNVTVSLEDQFSLDPEVRVTRPKLFCNPVDKNGEGIIDEASHLTCYDIDGNDKERVVFIVNQLDAQSLKVKRPELLCVPSEKLSFEVRRRR